MLANCHGTETHNLSSLSPQLKRELQPPVFHLSLLSLPYKLATDTNLDPGRIIPYHQHAFKLSMLSSHDTHRSEQGGGTLSLRWA